MPAKTKPKYGLGVGMRPVELALPSGNTCLARRPGAQGLIKANLLNDLDQLTALVQVELIDSKDPRKMAQAVKGLARDPAKVLEAMEMIDRVTAFVVAEPKVLTRPKKPPELDGNLWDAEAASEELMASYPGALWAEDVDEEDKMFIFQWCVGGTSDLVAFRAESSAALGALSALNDVPDATEPTPGD